MQILGGERGQSEICDHNFSVHQRSSAEQFLKYGVLIKSADHVHKTLLIQEASNW